MEINFRLILSLLGYLITAIGLLMLAPALLDLYMGDKGTGSFFIFSLIISFIGMLLAFANKKEQTKTLSTKDGLILTLLSWIVIVGFAALPLKFSYLQLSYTDAYFEIMSGITTTGATIVVDLNDLSYGFHLWRGLIQWVGGIGIIVTAVILIPSLQGGGMQLFKVEAFETFDNAIDKAKKIALGMIIIYATITIVILFALLFIGELSLFDSLIHSLTSVSTAGFSNKNASIAHFNSPVVEVILMFGMLSGALPYVLLYNLFFLRKINIFKDEQVIGLFKLVIFFIVIMTLWLSWDNGLNIFYALRYSSFSVISLITGTGYVSYDYSTFGVFPTMLLFTAMFIGGCAGSTACGIKVYRFQIAYVVSKTYLSTLFLKKHVAVSYYNGKFINNDASTAVFVYFFLFLIILAIASVLLSSLELDFMTAFSAVVTCLTNVGPGIGDIVGPVGNFSTIPDTGKWILSIVMLLGRLEIFGVIIILSKKFWIS